MGWEFAAVWVDDPDQAWRWMWRRVADDSGAVLQQSREFPHLDDCLAEHLTGGLTAARAARLKWWTTELQMRVADRCLQLHGGYGYMSEHAVAKAFTDGRIQTIYGGTTEIMKEIIGRSLLG